MYILGVRKQSRGIVKHGIDSMNGPGCRGEVKFRRVFRNIYLARIDGCVYPGREARVFLVWTWCFAEYRKYLTEYK